MKSAILSIERDKTLKKALSPVWKDVNSGRSNDDVWKMNT